jgi:hypothetical protein
LNLISKDNYFKSFLVRDIFFTAKETKVSKKSRLDLFAKKSKFLLRKFPNLRGLESYL